MVRPFVLLAALWACRSTPPVPPADTTRLAEVLAFPSVDGPLDVRLGEPAPVEGGTLFPLRYSLVPGFDAQAVLLRPETATGAGVLVAQGHFGEGKSSPEAQEVALRLVQRGAVVLIVDTPGVEEAEVPGRVIHFDEGAHNRALLAAGGTSAMGLQLALLRRGLDVLENEGAQRLGVTGASGGAVQSLYLGILDARVQAVVLASFPPTPREARAGGCPCDQLPGWPGPDPSVSAALRAPSLWLRDGPGPAPAGLPSNGSYIATAGPHSFTDEMQGHALTFFARHLDLRTRDDLGPAPVRPVNAGALPPDARSVFALHDVLQPRQFWSPAREGDGHHELSCQGSGPVVVVAGGDAQDQAALVAVGFRACAVRVPEDAAGHDEAIATQGPAYVNRLAGAVAEAAERVQARAVWGVRAWGLVAAGTGLPYVVRDPVLRLDQVDPQRDPAWIHVPGAWWGAVEAGLVGARAMGPDPVALAQQLREDHGG